MTSRVIDAIRGARDRSSRAADLIQGTDVVQLEAGKLQSVTGFLDKVPAGA